MATTEIACSGSHYTVLGHSRSPISCPTESPMPLHMNDIHLHPILYHFQVIVQYWSYFQFQLEVLHFNALILSNVYVYHRKLDSFGYISVADGMGLTSIGTT